jgi:hypothetical protein
MVEIEVWQAVDEDKVTASAMTNRGFSIFTANNT